VKQKTCKAASCNRKFTPARPLQSCCSIACAIEYSNRIKAKQISQESTSKRKEHREAKERIKSRADHIKEAQTAFNRYIRARDADLPCISCGRFHDGQWHAGHYRTTAAAPELRFDERNVHKQCAPCNNHKHGNITEYRINLVKLFGNDFMEWLEGPHEPKKYTILELKEIKEYYKKRLKELKD
jgi:hypothetical protein